MRGGSLYAFGRDLYVEESEVRFYGFRLQTRMAVIRLSDDRLMLYSPVWLSSRLRHALDRLGDVAYVVAPNKIHNQTLHAYADAYPAAGILAPPGLPERCPDLPIAANLADAPHFEWRGDIDLALTDGNVFFREVLLFHQPSRTLLVGDLVENFERSTASPLGRGVARLFGVGRRPVCSPEFRLFTLDAEAAARSFARAARWDFDRIFLCHGGLVTENANQVFRNVTDELVHRVRKRSPRTRSILQRLATLR